MRRFQQILCTLPSRCAHVAERCRRSGVGRLTELGRRTPMRVHHVAFIALLALTGSAHAQTAGGTSGPAGSSLGATPTPGTPTPGNPTGAPATLPSPGPGTTTGSSAPSPGTAAPPV